MILCGYIENTPVKSEVKRRKEKHVPEILSIRRFFCC